MLRGNEIFKEWDARYKDEKWSVCCNGRDCCCLGKPTDPEYYIYEEMKQLKIDVEKIA